MIRDNYQIR